MPQNGSSPACLFCRWIRNGQAVETFGGMAAFEDGHPVTEGHLLLVPLRHTPDWFTMTDRELRDADAAVLLAERAWELTKDRSDAHRLKILAGVYAEAGRLDQAVAMITQAISLAEAAGDMKMAGELRDRLKLLRKGLSSGSQEPRGPR